MHKQPRQSSAFRFRRFQRAGWAAYSSMHREVTIGRLSTRVADCSLAKAAATLALGLVLAQGSAAAQSDNQREERTLPEVQIMPPADSLMGSPEPVAVITAQEIQHNNIRSLADLVALLPGVDMRVRGVGDAQSDISMRGGTFDQMVLLLNGVNLTDVQTGHHTMDLPIDIGMVQRVELLSPAQLMARGIVAFCGGVNLVVSDDYADRLRAELSGGSYGTLNASLLASHAAGRWRITAAGAYHRSDGYMPNTDYNHGSLMLQAARHSDNDDLLLQVGGQMKGFGSQAFYSTTYPDQYEATRTLTAAVTHLHRSGDVRLESCLYGRLHRDRFELFREGMAEPAPWYTGHNHHLSSIAGLRSRVVLPLSVGEALAGVDLRRDGIHSNVLGLPDTTLPTPYTHHAERLGASLFAGWHYATHRLNLQTVALGHLDSQFGYDYGLAADAEYRIAVPSAIYLSVSHTYRLPTFTDLYYHSASQQANPDLNSEHSTAVDLGLRNRFGRHTIDLSLYYRAGSDIIDWVRRPEEEMWYSMNHTAVDAMGLDASATLRLASLTLLLDYSYCHVALDAGQWVSGSAMDYLSHRATTHLVWDATARLRLKAGASWRQRHGQWVDANGNVHDYGNVLLADAAAEYRWRKVTLFAEGYNLLDRPYRDHGGVPMLGRTWLAGLRLEM